ncbi:hypothetical protein FXF68_36780 [Actinomadura decatromicini]|uniref:Uncharacterized protein n=1 Tax=Actinomadura decatromicini TaxID=2604572 RepID=A0A5D3F7B5_9ACTN|nr:hypothetical protein FXF68_36780 [Actinomadura decatromicini]
MDGAVRPPPPDPVLPPPPDDVLPPPVLPPPLVLPPPPVLPSVPPPPPGPPPCWVMSVRSSSRRSRRGFRKGSDQGAGLLRLGVVLRRRADLLREVLGGVDQELGVLEGELDRDRVGGGGAGAGDAEVAALQVVRAVAVERVSGVGETGDDDVGDVLAVQGDALRVGRLGGSHGCLSYRGAASCSLVRDILGHGRSSGVVLRRRATALRSPQEPSGKGHLSQGGVSSPYFFVPPGVSTEPDVDVCPLPS